MCSLWNFPSLAYLLAKFHVSVLPSIFVGRDWRTQHCCAWSIPNKIASEINVCYFVSYGGYIARFQENMFDCSQHIPSLTLQQMDQLHYLKRIRPNHLYAISNKQHLFLWSKNIIISNIVLIHYKGRYIKYLLLTIRVNVY